jgi:hypothetical protein
MEQCATRAPNLDMDAFSTCRGGKNLSLLGSFSSKPITHTFDNNVTTSSEFTVTAEHTSNDAPAKTQARGVEDQRTSQRHSRSEEVVTDKLEP